MIGSRFLRRFLNVHEYQSQAIMKSYGVASPRGIPATTPEQVYEAAKKLGGNVAVKSQILAGGRGLGTFKNGFQGGVHLVKTPEEAQKIAEKMLGQTLVTKQTGEEGKLVSTVLVSEFVQPKKQYYFAITMDRASGGPVLIGSSEGGVDIEGVAHKDPNAIKRVPLHPDGRNEPAKYLELARQIGIPEKHREQAADVFERLYTIFRELDATMVEINPLAEIADGTVMAFDAKFNFDDNAAQRQVSIFNMRDPTQEDPRDVAAAKWDLNYIGLDGNIACLVNGAGLAMATMDIINLAGGKPANFLDVGGSASREQVGAAFRLLTSDSHVKAIFVNIFGGIMQCDIIAKGIIDASKDIGIKVPLIVRLKGTNSEKAKELIEKSGLPIFYEEDFEKAAHLAVKEALKK